MTLHCLIIIFLASVILSTEADNVKSMKDDTICKIKFYKTLGELISDKSNSSDPSKTFIFGLTANHFEPLFKQQGILDGLMPLPPDSYTFLLLGIDTVGAAVNLAVEDFCRKENLHDFTFSIIYLNDGCNPSMGIPDIIQMYQAGVDVVFGMPCSSVTIHAGYYLKHYNIPVISHSSSDSLLSNKQKYQTLIRLADSFKQIGSAFVEIFKSFRWSTISMLSSVYGACPYSKALIQQAVEDDDTITIVENNQVPEVPSDEQLLRRLQYFKERSRVLVICMQSAALVRLMEIAYDLGMTSSEYVYIAFFARPSRALFYPWGDTNGVDEHTVMKRKSAFANFKMVSPQNFENPDEIQLMKDITDRMSEDPWYISTAKKLAITESPYGLYLYDCVWLYLSIMNETLNEGKDPRNGTLVFEKSRNRAFHGASGDVKMDDNADRNPVYWIWHLTPGKDMFTHFATVITYYPEGNRVDIMAPVYWGTPNGKPPPNEPACGYRDENCQPSTARRDKAIIGGLICLVVVLIAVYIGFLYYRKRKYEEEIEKMTWKILFEDIKTVPKRSASTMAASLRSFCTIALQHDESGGQNQSFTNVCVYKGVLCSIRKIVKTDCKLNRQDLIDLKQVKDLNHENVNSFIGACVQPPNIFIVTNNCSKGSLMEILHEDEIKLDWMFKCSLIFDLVNGLYYIHQCPFSSHGHLTSSACIIDSRWVLKIADVGLSTIKYVNVEKNDNVGEYELFWDDLWVSPELLRENERQVRGTQKGDIYSLGIILQEIIFRALPFFIHDNSPKEIITKVKASLDPPFRPVVPRTDNKTNLKVVALMKQCWAENPDVRPDVKKVKNLMQSISGSNIDILNSVVQKLERYANNLEEIVESRTEELMIEKQKTDSLLYRMLPSVVAERLKNGLTVSAEMYEAVSIFFSDIVGFTALSSQSSPVQIVDFLNDLYSVFDDIIAKHDVYKVETIGDAYMCVSGCPNRNGDKHAVEIVDMSLSLRENVKKYKIRHKPGRSLQVRIGIHTGPCASGVVGLTMPRYCLFGDTVNVASRMESTGQTMKIHISEATYKSLSGNTDYDITCRGEVQIKGKGIVTTYWLEKITSV